MTLDDLALLLRQAGLDVAPETIAELHGVYAPIDAMITRVNVPTEDQPMHVFAPVELQP
jgi:hypothetical protein